MKFYLILLGAFTFVIGGGMLMIRLVPSIPPEGTTESKPYVPRPMKTPDYERYAKKKTPHVTEDGAIFTSKEIIKKAVRDPSSVKWNEEVAWVKEGTMNVSIDFTASNGFGGPVRDTWFFTYSIEGKVASVITSKGDQIFKAN